MIRAYNYLKLFLSLIEDKLLSIITSKESSKKEWEILKLSAKYPNIGAVIAKPILRIKLLTDITVALIFDSVLILIWFLSNGVNIPLK